ncbi:DUF1707 and DUF4870 domain-containing protein [Luteococcus sp. H138]|uniref:DUF1707 and DUF4870 domain-containing protein n=1 Tax=unclassified Luteococcus TaxID=2639923 RepID=UPI00313CB861
MSTTIAPRKPSVMSAFEHPSLGLPVTEDQRERSLAYLQQAYAEGRLTIYELDARVETVLQASTRREMNRAFEGLARIPVGAGASLLMRPTRPTGVPGPMGRTGATVAHLTGLGSFFVGPAVCYALAPHESYARREAAKAFNFQLVALVVMAITGALTEGFLGGALSGVLGITWLVLTVAGISHAASGDDWRNPVSRLVPLRPLDEGRPQGRRPKEITR